MKLSHYNILKIFDDRYFVFNTLNSTFIELTLEEFNILNKKDIQNLNKSLSEKLVKNGMIVNNDIDELFFLKNRYLKEQHNRDLLTITIAPTLRCNFACPYCYENRDGKIINEDEQTQIITFIESQLKLGYINFNMIWFGGEPLLAFDIIESMSKKIIDLCNKYGVNYNAFLTTNGYLLNENISKKLTSLKINQLFVTLDGLSDIHDKRRCLINGRSTFATITENLRIAKNHNINIVVRMNIDKTNENEIENLRKYVTDDLQLPMYLGLVREYTESCQNEKNSYFTKEEYAHIQDSFDNSQEKGNKAISKFPRQLPIYCRACKIGTFVIDPDLNLFKCENDIGRPEKRISSLEDYPFDDEINKVNNKSFYKWNPFEYQQCLDCNIMPICMGGCPFVGIKSNNPECEIYKYNFDNVAKKLVLKNVSTSI